MHSVIAVVYYSLLFISCVFGVVRYQYLDKALRSLVILLVVTSVSEVLSYLAVDLEEYTIRYAIFHVFNIFQIILLTQFFIYAIKPYYLRKLIVTSYIVWPLIGLLNIAFLQPLNKLNTNILLLESFSVITMSLYYVYWLLKNDAIKNVFKHPHFQFAVISLISWSGTFFFWAFIGVLYNDDWPYTYLVMHGHAILNILVYTAIATILFFYPKMKKLENR